ncbi:hypothetical protein Cgig2_008263 [Carnegiea gigantea]|uniref:Protein kinase domain-containing protein n=1 Tax=Carnegiea gigantea TaxID=171969 RepID=A0A9Q1L123_9CARY|nr:hypothetical protein Cgig2_008263 [Carnegiea gigantea]
MSTGSGSASEETTKKPRLNQGDIKDRYNVTEVLGSGAYGSVYLVTDTLNGGTFAMKQIPLDGKDIQGCHTREFSPLQEIDHPNIVKLKRVFVEQQYIYVVMEYLRWDLKTFVEEHANMFEVPMTLKSFTKQLLSAVHFCHMNEFIHRDLKPENILIKMQEEGIIVKLADFGQSRGWIHGGANLTPEINMLSYRAPEMILGSRTYTSAVDMWGVGCVLAFILQLDAPFPGETSYAVLDGIFR